MTTRKDFAIDVQSETPTLPDGVRDVDTVVPEVANGCRIFIHYNGPTDQLSGMCTGMLILDPGATPHPPHQHPEEEILIVADGTGEIECAGKITQVGPGAIMYCAGDVMHGIVNTGKVPLTFYWSKWMARSGR